MLPPNSYSTILPQSLSNENGSAEMQQDSEFAQNCSSEVSFFRAIM